MSVTRKIKIYTTSGMPGTIETNVATLGELKPLLRDREINVDGMKMLVGETKNELSVDEAVLPETDFKLYLMPAKTKSGIDFDDLEENIENIEDKVDRILGIVSNLKSKLTVAPTTPKVVASTSTISTEDQREIEELKRLAEGRSSEWD